MLSILSLQLYFQLVGDCENGQYAPRAGVAQLAEHELLKLGVAGSNPVPRPILSCETGFDAADVSMTQLLTKNQRGTM